MLKKIFALLMVLFFPVIVKATILCPKCEVGSCVCEVLDCSSGIVDIFEEKCSPTPMLELTFSGSSFEWKPTSSGTYYMLALCDDGRTKTGCEEIEVKSQKISPTTTTTKREEPKGYTPPEDEGEWEEEEEGGVDIVTLLLFLTLVILIGLGLILMLQKRKGKKTWEEIYRKWGRRFR